MTDDFADKRGLDPPVTTARRSVVARKRTTALLRGLVLVLAEHNAPHEHQVALRRQVHEYLDKYSDEGLWVEHAKSVFAHPFSQYLNNEPPPKPSGGYFVPKGPLKRWLKVRQNRFSGKNTHFWYSWLQTKRSCLPCSEGYVENAYRKHASTLSREDDGDDITIDRIMANPSFLLHLDEVRDGIIRNHTDGGFETSYRPSLRSCLTRTRGQGGALAELRKNMSIFPRDNSISHLLECSQLVKMSYERIVRSYQGRTIVSFEVVEYRGYDLSLDDEWSNSVEGGRIFSEALTDATPLQCKITGIIEPLKVRVISRGPAHSITFARNCKRRCIVRCGRCRRTALLGVPCLGEIRWI